VGASAKSEIMARPPEQQQATGFAKRVLIVDPDQTMWELCARLLIAQGHIVRRINNIADAPPRWPHYLYNLVVVATQDPASDEVMEFCRKLRQVEPPVPVALLVGGSQRQSPAAAPLISREQPATAIAEEIARLLR
jgi:CheY-like chemotaxis protein